MMLVERLQPAMLRVALMYVSTRAVAEDVVAGRLGRGAEGARRLRGPLVAPDVDLPDRRRTRRRRAVSARPAASPSPRSGPPIRTRSRRSSPARFGPPGHPAAGRWAEPPVGWESTPEERLLSKETLAEVSRAIDALPPNQREVIRMRDVLGWPSADVRNALDISETNQRVLLHRARAKVRRGARGVPGTGEGAEVVNCIQLVELVTDYLEGAMPAERGLGSTSTSRAATAARTYLEQFRDHDPADRHARARSRSRPTRASTLLGVFRRLANVRLARGLLRSPAPRDRPAACPPARRGRRCRSRSPPRGPARAGRAPAGGGGRALSSWAYFSFSSALMISSKISCGSIVLRSSHHVYRLSVERLEVHAGSRSRRRRPRRPPTRAAWSIPNARRPPRRRPACSSCRPMSVTISPRSSRSTEPLTNPVFGSSPMKTNTPAGWQLLGLARLAVFGARRRRACRCRRPSAGTARPRG